VKSRLLQLLYLNLKAIALPLGDLRVERITRFIDQIMPVLNEQAKLIITLPGVYACKVELHSGRLSICEQCRNGNVQIVLPVGHSDCAAKCPRTLVPTSTSAALSVIVIIAFGGEENWPLFASQSQSL
jgi:hypothetical protein